MKPWGSTLSSRAVCCELWSITAQAFSNKCVWEHPAVELNFFSSTIIKQTVFKSSLLIYVKLEQFHSNDELLVSWRHQAVRENHQWHSGLVLGSSDGGLVAAEQLFLQGLFQQGWRNRTMIGGFLLIDEPLINMHPPPLPTHPTRTRWTCTRRLWKRRELHFFHSSSSSSS